MSLIEEIRAGSARAIARAISLIEDLEPDCEALVDELFPAAGGSLVLGVTGSPGAGKSTLVDGLIKEQRARGGKVAVIAVDPSSPFSGGAVLGDRLRMQDHATDPGVFIRSMASRGYLGGVAATTGDVIKVLEAAGYGTIIIETIGVGQTEIKIVELSDVVLLVLMPETGDEVQVMKAGVMEIGDIFVVNKKDLPGADRLRAEVEYALSFKTGAAGGEGRPGKAAANPVLLTSAVNDDGVRALWETILAYEKRMEASGELERKRRFRLERELLGILKRKFHELLDVRIEFSRQLPGWADSLYRRQARPYALINEQIHNFLKEKQGDREN
jgi:LAO/AO transport system kinase